MGYRIGSEGFLAQMKENSLQKNSIDLHWMEFRVVELQDTCNLERINNNSLRRDEMPSNLKTKSNAKYFVFGPIRVKGLRSFLGLSVKFGFGDSFESLIPLNSTVI